MRKLKVSTKIYFCLVIALAVLAALNVFLPQGDFMLTQELPATKAVLALVNAVVILILYGGIGFVGLKLSQILGFADIWDSKVSNRERFLLPALLGVGLGVFFIISDVIFSQFHSFGSLPHPPFPTSLVASAAAGIGEEIIFRLFFISFWVWLISHVILRKKWKEHVFWVVTMMSALAFAAGHIPALMIIFELKTISEIPYPLLAEIVLLNGVLSIFAAYYFRKFGFIAAVGIHFWTDVIWHVIWGAI